MSIELRLLNCFWLILPLLAWNLLLGPRIKQDAITSDAHSSKGLLIAENGTRILVFALPLFMPLPRPTDWQFALPETGFIIYIAGTLIYFASWLPLIFVPASAWSSSSLGLLAPRLTPFLSFLGIASIGGSWPYGLVSAVFIFIHTWHGVQNL